MAPVDIENKNPDELTAHELSCIHLDAFWYGTYYLKECKTRSMLSFIVEGIQTTMVNNRAKNIMPIMSLMSILDQLGICYNNIDKVEPRFKNGIKRSLYFFGDLDENNEIIKVLYALRNGLMHNISLVSKSEYTTTENYYFRYDADIEGVYKLADIPWTGDFSNLNMQTNVTLINTENLRSLVYKCIDTANHLNNEHKLHIRLADGLMELYYCFLRTVSK